MRRPARALTLVLTGLLLLTACGEDAETASPDDAGPGEVTDAGEEGAFGEADSCDRLVEEAVASYGRVVAELGDADRSQSRRIDAALDSFGGAGPDLAVRYDALDCGDEFDAEVCVALAALEPGGPAARDFLDDARQGCGPDR